MQVYSTPFVSVRQCAVGSVQWAVINFRLKWICCPLLTAYCPLLTATSNDNRKQETLTLRTAVIGVGHLGRQHARIHSDLASEGLTQFASVCDLDEKTGR